MAIPELRDTLSPSQNVNCPLAEIIGLEAKGTTVITMESTAVFPMASVTVKKYLVVTEGLALVIADPGSSRPATGVHE